MNTAAIIYGPNGAPISTPATRRAAAAPRIRARYDAAATTDENTRHWANADYLGPNAALSPAVRRTIRARARYEFANNTYCYGTIRTIAADTIGTGPLLQIADPRLDADSSRDVEMKFWRWTQRVKLGPKLRTLRITKCRDGEAFATIFTNPQLRSAGVTLDLQLHEPEMIAATAYDRSAVLSLTDGIIVDDFGNVVGYNLLKDHPGEMSIDPTADAELIPAEFMIHQYSADRPGQYRGISEIAPALPLYAQLRRYTLAVIRAAESAAIPSWILETQAPPMEGVDYSDPFDTVETERGMGLTLPAGYKMSQLRAEHPTSTYASFKKEILAEISRALNVPYNVAAGDSSGYNYSSGRLDHRNYFKSLNVERGDIEDRDLDGVILRHWWAEARRIPGYLPAAAAALDEPPAHEWRWDGEEHIDPTKEAEATGTRLKYGLTSYPREVARLGGDLETVHAENALALGLTAAEYQQHLRAGLYGTAAVPTSPAVPAANNTDDTNEKTEPAADDE